MKLFEYEFPKNNEPKDDTEITKDEQPFNADINKIPNLKPAFSKDGTVTAANSSSISDGAAALVMMTIQEAEKKKIEIWAYATNQMVNISDDGNFSLAIKVMESNENIPIILADENDSILNYRNLNPINEITEEYLQKHSQKYLLLKQVQL